MKRLLVLTIIIFLLSGCKTEFSKEIEGSSPAAEEIKPPKVAITTKNGFYPMRQGGFNWTIEGERKGETVTSIADTAVPSESIKDGKLISISKTEVLALLFTVEPERYELYGWYIDGTKNKVTKLEGLKGDTPVAIEVLTYYPQGYASYVLPVIFE